jgi:dienelactone hydrolase
MTVPSQYTLLPHLASHGFVVIAANTSSVAAADLTGGLDWLESENGRSGSDFYQKLDTSNVAAMGYSLGGLGTFQIAADKRLKTTVHISGGTGDSAVANLKNPAAFFCGDPTISAVGVTVGDIARPQCDTDFNNATVPVFYGNFIGGSHMGVMTSPYMERIRAAVTGWLRWRLMADETRKAMFVGSDCTLCKDSNWKVQQKDMK